VGTHGPYGSYRSYALTSRIRDTSPWVHTMCFPKYKLLIVSRAACARSLVTLLRGPRRSWETIIIAVRGLLAAATHERAVFSLRLYEISSPFFRAWLTPPSVPCSIHEGGRARGTVIRTVRPRRFNCTFMCRTYARTRAATTDICRSFPSTSLSIVENARLSNFLQV